MTISRFVTAAVCVLGPLTCLSHGASITGEATFISFSVPGVTQGTFPLSINASMAVTGYYRTASANLGFIRAQDGTITSFAVPGASSTLPASMNAAGDITGFYEITPYDQHCFIRYADGRILHCDPPAALSSSPVRASSVSINDYGDIAGNYVANGLIYLFTRSAEGVYKTQTSFAAETVPGAINASGSVVGFAADDQGAYLGFVVHPDGYSETFSVPLPQPTDAACLAATIPEGINAAGVIAGWYYSRCSYANQGFVLSPDGVFTTFASPGVIDASAPSAFDLFGAHWISIDEAGDITGTYTDELHLRHGFVRNPYGTSIGFDPPECQFTNPTSINNGGAITGFCQYETGGSAVGFIRVPQLDRTPIKVCSIPGICAENSRCTRLIINP